MSAWHLGMPPVFCMNGCTCHWALQHETGGHVAFQQEQTATANSKAPWLSRDCRTNSLATMRPCFQRQTVPVQGPLPDMAGTGGPRKTQLKPWQGKTHVSSPWEGAHPGHPSHPPVLSALPQPHAGAATATTLVLAAMIPWPAQQSPSWSPHTQLWSPHCHLKYLLKIG